MATGSDEALPDDWREQVRRLADERDAVILAHNYQLPEIQDIADHVGDSLGLSRVAAAGRGVDDRVLRRPLHGRDGQDPQLRQDGADPRRAGRVQPRRHDHRRPAAGVEGRAPRRRRRQLRQHDRGGEGRDRHLLHVVERRRRRRLDPRGHRGAVLPRPVPRRPRAAHHRPREHAHLARRVPRARRHQRRRPEGSGSPRIRTPSCSSTPSAAAPRARSYLVGAGVVPETRTKILSTSGMVDAARETTAKKVLVATETGMLHQLTQGQPARDLRAGQPRRGVQVHEDDHRRPSCSARCATAPTRSRVDRDVADRARASRRADDRHRHSVARPPSSRACSAPRIPNRLERAAPTRGSARSTSSCSVPAPPGSPARSPPARCAAR